MLSLTVWYISPLMPGISIQRIGLGLNNIKVPHSS